MFETLADPMKFGKTVIYVTHALELADLASNILPKLLLAGRYLCFAETPGATERGTRYGKVMRYMS